MPDTSDISSLLRDLRAADSSLRRQAAGGLFRIGSELAIAASSRWFADRALAACFRLSDDSGLPPLAVGVAVEPRAFDEIHTAFGSPPLALVPPDQDAKEFSIVFGDDVQLDILTTRAPGGSGVIERFLARFGEGIQQIEFTTTNLDRATEILRERFAVEPVYPAARQGADSTRVNFFLVPAVAPAKVLIELVEAPESAAEPA